MCPKKNHQKCTSISLNSTRWGCQARIFGSWKNPMGRFVCRLCQENYTTLPKFNMELENHPLEKGKTSSKPPFLGSMLVFGWVYPLQVEQLARENIPSPKGKDRLPSNHRFFRGKLAVKLPGVYHLEDFRVWTPKKWRCFFYLAYLLVT